MKSFSFSIKAFSIVFLCLFIFLQCDYITGDKTINLNENESNEPDYREAPLIIPTNDDYYVLGGDILLDNTDENRDREIIADTLEYMLDANANNSLSKAVIGAPESSNEYTPIKNSTIATLIKKWTWSSTAGVIPYFYYNIPGWENEYGTLRYKIRQAMNLMESACNVHFVNIPVNMDTYGTIPVYKIYLYTENRSTIGPVTRPRMDIRDNADLFSIVHLLGHCLGLQHEHQRYDRDTYVQIDWDNIARGQWSNYTKIPQSIKYITIHHKQILWWRQYYTRTHNALNSATWGTYDYDSLMHAGAFDNAVDSSQKTIVVLNEEVLGGNINIGQRNHLSATDKIALEALYGISHIPYISIYREALGSATNRIPVISGQPWVPSASSDQEFLIELTPPEAGGNHGRTLTFSIENFSSAPLQLTSNNILTLDGDPEFSVVKYPKKTIAGKSTSNFYIRFYAEIPGTYTSQVTIENNSHTRVFTFPVRGTAYEPDQIQAVPWGPNELNLDVISNNQINLTWDDNSDIETGYAIYRKDNEATGFVQIANLAPDSTYFEDTDVYYNPGNWWDRVWYQLYAYNDFGRSEIVGARLPASALSYWDIAYWNIFSYWE